MVVHNYNPWEVEAGGSRSVQGYPQLPSESEVSLGFMRPCLKENLSTGWPDGSADKRADCTSLAT